MGLNEPDSKSHSKLKSTTTASASLPSTGRTSSDMETSAPSTGQLFPEWTCSAGDSPAKTLALPESEQGLTGNAQGSGVNTSEPFAHFDHDSSSWRTSQVSLLTSTWDVFSETWPRAGTMRNGIASQQVPLAPLTGEIGSGLLPTPRATEHKGGHSSKGGPSLGMMATHNLWPTPTARDHKDTGANVNWAKVKAKCRLAGAAGGSLNPTWVEWLMGYPQNWTSLED